MRESFFFCFLFLTFPVCAVQETLANEKEKEGLVPVEVEEVRPAVVKILISGKNNNDTLRENKQESYNLVNSQSWIQTQGTGFIIHGKIVVTNFHLLRKFKSDISFQIHNQFGKEFPFKRVTHLSALDDLAVLEVGNDEGFSLTLQPLSDIDNFFSAGLCFLSFKMKCDNIYIPAFPMGDFIEIEGRFKINLDDMYYLDTQFSGSTFGASGGPVLNEKGEVIGIFRGENDDDLLAVPVDILIAWLQNPALPSTEKLENLINKEKAHLEALVAEGNMRAFRMWHSWLRSDIISMFGIQEK